MIDVGRDFERMQDYVVGRLSDDERRAFEDRLARDPALVQELEQSLRLREGLQQLREQGELARARPWTTSWRTWSPLLAAAAIAAVALFLRAQLAAPDSQFLRASIPSAVGGGVPAAAAHLTFVATRSDTTPVVEVPGTGVVELRAAPGQRLPASLYRVTLIRSDAGSSQTLGTANGLKLGADGYVHSYADASKLEPGSYRLRVEPEGVTAAPTDEFPFDLRRAHR